MPLTYKKVLIIGATSGIGAAIADKLVENGVFVIAAGRRKENLDKFVAKHGPEKAAAAVIDILKLKEIPAFASALTLAHPDIDCVFLNAGIQRGSNFADPSSVDTDTIYQELLANYLSHVHLTKAFLPSLQNKSDETALVYATSQLGLTPMLRCPNYSGSKAAMHSFVLCLREQMKTGPGNVKVVEVYPPAVQTELHDAKNQPDLKNGHLIGMQLTDFVDELYERLARGEEQIPIGTAKDMFVAFENARQAHFQAFNDEMNQLLVGFTA